MTEIAAMKPVETVRDASRAATLLLHPLRSRILAQAREPVSASELARRFGQPRQRINYHVRQLARAGLLLASGQQRKRNMLEQQYIASARAYVLAADLLGEATPQLDAVQDPASAMQLIALCARAESEVAALIETANAAGVRVRTLSMHSEVRFASLEQRAEFTHELIQTVSDVVARYSAPAGGHPFRLLLGCYPSGGR